MRTSKLFFRTFKQEPAEAEITSHKLLERAGYIKKVGKGLFIYTPIMWRVVRKIEAIIREEMEKAGAQEVCLPLLHPKELWERSGRWEEFIAEGISYRVTDREDREFCLGPTHEEMVTFLVSNWVTSYKHLPLNLYQMGPKFRDEIRPRFGLMRGKEFLMKDGYSFSDTPVMMEKQYEAMREAYSQVFRRLGLDFVIVHAHGGKIAKGKSEEFQVKAEVGEDAVLMCNDYAVNIEAAKAIPPVFEYDKKEKEKQKISTPNISTIDELVTFTKLPAQQMVKSVIYKLIFPDKEEFVTIGIRADREINEIKVADKFQAIEVALASDAEIVGLTGVKPGFCGPLNLRLSYFADTTCQHMKNFVTAANEPDVHYLNVNWGRDCPHPEFDDFLLAEEGDACPHIPGGVYRIQRGIEVGHIFNIGTRYSSKLEASFQTQEGETKPFWMGTYGIGIGRSAQAVIEQSHDERGIVWPIHLAPFKILITAATLKSESGVKLAEEIYAHFLKHGIEALLDDRDERLGFKLRDSDLMGIPYKLIIGKSYEKEGKVEVESRQGEKKLLTPQELKTWATSLKQ